MVQNQPAKQEMQVQSLSWEDPLKRKWQPTPVFLPGKSHGQRSLSGYNPWGHKRVGYNLATKQQNCWVIWVGCRLRGRTESDTTEATQQQQQQHENSIFSLLKKCQKIKKCQPIFRSSCVTQHPHQQSQRVPISCQHLLLSDFLILHPSGCEVVSHCGFDVHFPDG